MVMGLMIDGGLMFSRLASLFTILGVGLYFTGWIYRWAYFGYFQIEITTLDLPIESFLIAPIQVFFGQFSSGDLSTFLRTCLVAIAISLLICLTLKLLECSSGKFAHFINASRNYLLKISLKQRHSRATRTLQIFPDLQPIDYDKNFLNELVIAGWCLAGLFYLGQTQGNLDAIRDAHNHTSMLPVVTVIAPENRLPLGRKINDLTDDPAVGNFRFIGDLELYETLLYRDYNDKTQPDQQIIWRLLIDRDSQYYIFPSLPENAPSDTRPPLVIIQQSIAGEYVIILSPEPGPRNP